MAPHQDETDPHDDPEARGLALPVVLLALTVVSGVIDAVSYLGLGHVFTANMTGNVVVLGFAAAGAPGFKATHSLVSLGGFLAGAFAGGCAWRRFGSGSRRRWTRTVLTVEAVLVGTCALVAYASPAAAGTVYALIAVTAFAMGVRNAAVRRLGVPELTTTVLTMTLTGLAADSRAAGGDGARAPRRAAAALAMLGGAALGAWLVLHHGLGLPLLLAALTSAVLVPVASGRTEAHRPVP
ncbi:YoaK family protein [Streptomyces sp. NPDC002004]